MFATFGKVQTSLTLHSLIANIQLLRAEHEYREANHSVS
jgi:hypothetical protein